MHSFLAQYIPSSGGAWGGHAFIIIHYALFSRSQNRNGIGGIEMAESSKKCIFCSK